MTDFHTSFHILQLLKSLLFHIPEAWKDYPFWAEPPHMDYREYPRGFCMDRLLMVMLHKTIRNIDF